MTLSPITPIVPNGGVPRGGLFGRQVFVVEDEALVSLMLEDMLARLGCVVAGLAASLNEALFRVQTTPDIDAAILDVNLGGQMIFPVADILQARGVPFVFSTAYGGAGLLDRYPRSRLLNKPYAPEDLADVLHDFMYGND